jgi:hypothetical protein
MISCDKILNYAEPLKKSNANHLKIEKKVEIDRQKIHSHSTSKKIKFFRIKKQNTKKFNNDDKNINVNNRLNKKSFESDPNINTCNHDDYLNKIEKHSKMIKMKNSDSTSSSNNFRNSIFRRSIRQSQINMSKHFTHTQEHNRLVRDSKAAKTLAIVVGGFVISWLPFFIMYILEAFLVNGSISKTTIDWITWLGYFNSAINPVSGIIIQSKYSIKIILMKI